MRKVLSVILSLLFVGVAVFGGTLPAHASEIVTTAEELSAAIASANSGDTIVIGSDITLNDTLQVKKDISLVGADSEGGSYALRVPAGFTKRHITASANAVFENLTFDGGGAGGGIWASRSGNSITVRNCDFVQNANDFSGGAIKALGPVTVERSTFKNNMTSGTVYGEGGAIQSGALVRVSDSLFDTNTTAAQGAYGGAISAQSVEVSNSVFTDNSSDHGGAIRTVGQTTTIQNCEFYSNESKTTYDGGGAIHANGGDATIDRSIFENNTSTADGGAVFGFNAVSITNSSFKRNEAASNGGGVFSYGALTVDNCSFTGNKSTSSYGGGIYSYGGAVVCASSFTENEAASGAGAAVCKSGIETINTTFYKNDATLSGGAVTIISKGHTGTFTNSTFYTNTAAGEHKTIATGENVTFVFVGSIAQTPTDDVRGTFSNYLVYSGQESDIFENPTTFSTHDTGVRIGADGLTVAASSKTLTLDYLPIKTGGPADNKIDVASTPWVPGTDEIGTVRSEGHADIGAVEVLGAKVVYDGNGNDSGSAPADPHLYVPGETVVVASSGDLAKVRHVFLGWNTQPDGSGTAYGASETFAMPDHAVTLYAIWKQSDSASTDESITPSWESSPTPTPAQNNHPTRQSPTTGDTPEALAATVLLTAVTALVLLYMYRRRPV